MLLEDLKEKLKAINLEIRENNYEEIFALYEGNEEFRKLSNEYPVTLEKVKEDVEDVPPFTDTRSKHYLSIYNLHNELVAVVDFIDGYSFQDKNNKNALWIGLLEIDKKRHNSGLGTLIFNTIADACRKNSKTMIQLGVIKENHKAVKFWRKVGFDVLREVNNGEFDLYVMEKSIG